MTVGNVTSKKNMMFSHCKLNAKLPKKVLNSRRKSSPIKQGLNTNKTGKDSPLLYFSWLCLCIVGWVKEIR